MGSTGKSRAHQPPGTQSSFPSIADLRLKSFRTTYPTSDRQHDGYRLHKSKGTQSRTLLDRAIEPLGVVPSEEDNHAHRAHPLVVSN